MEKISTLFNTRLCMAILLLLVCSGNAMAQTEVEKPRYLKKPLGMCPIDMRLQLDSRGVLVANSKTIGLDTVKKTVKAVSDITDTAGKVIVKAGSNYVAKVLDTTLKQTIFFEKGTAFDVVATIGSYSIIRLWDTDKKTKKPENRKQEDASIFEASEKYGTSLDALTNTGDNNIVRDKFLVYKLDGETKDAKPVVIANLTHSEYILPTTALNDNSVEFEYKDNKWNLGVLLLPVKLRPFATRSGQFDFTDGFSVGTTFSFTLSHNWKKDKTANVLLYAGLSSFTVDSAKINEKRDDYKIAAFSPAIGLMMEKSSIQLSLLVGMDFPAGSVQKQWVYRNMPWVGLGLGFSLFKLSSNTTAETGTN